MKKLNVFLAISCFSFSCTESLQAKIPFNNVFHLDEAFKGFEGCHPLLGWTALQKNIIHNVRFNGNFYYDKENPIKDQPLDSVSNLVKMLFPSEDGTLSSFLNHPENIGGLIKSDSMRHPGVIAMMLRLVKAQKKVLASKGEERKENERELDKVREALFAVWKGCAKFGTKVAKGFIRPKVVVDELTECLLTSVGECVEDLEARGDEQDLNFVKKNPIFVHSDVTDESMDPVDFIDQSKVHSEKSNMKKVYPPYFVEQILMAFLCDRFDTREDILSFSKILNLELYRKKEDWEKKKMEGKKNNKEKVENDTPDNKWEYFILTKDDSFFNKKNIIETYMNSVYSDSFFESPPFYNGKKESAEEVTEKQTKEKPDISFLKESPNAILSLWERDARIPDFYTLYAASLNNQEECLTLLKIANAYSKEENEMHRNFLKKVIQSIKWDNSETAGRGIDSLINLTQKMGASHSLFESLKILNMPFLDLLDIKEGDLPVFIEELNARKTPHLASFSGGSLTNLKKLSLYSSGIQKIKRGDLPFSLEELNLGKTQVLKEAHLPSSLHVLSLDRSNVKNVYFQEYPKNIAKIYSNNKDIIFHIPHVSEEQRSFLNSQGVFVIEEEIL